MGLRVQVPRGDLLIKNVIGERPSVNNPENCIQLSRNEPRKMNLHHTAIDDCVNSSALDNIIVLFAIDEAIH